MFTAHPKASDIRVVGPMHKSWLPLNRLYTIHTLKSGSERSESAAGPAGETVSLAQQRGRG